MVLVARPESECSAAETVAISERARHRRLCGPAQRGDRCHGGRGRDTASGQTQAKQITCPRQPPAHCPDRPTQPVGGAFVCQLFEVAEHDGMAVLFRQPRQLDIK